MSKFFFFFISIFLSFHSFSQNSLAPLTVEKIMKDPKWIGSSPSSPQWSIGSDTLFFMWNPDKAEGDSVYFITVKDHQPQKNKEQNYRKISSVARLSYNADRSKYVVAQRGNVVLVDVEKGNSRTIISGFEDIRNPSFGFADTKIIYEKDNNIFAWDIASGMLLQLTNISRDAPPVTNKEVSQKGQEGWLAAEQLRYMQVLRERKNKKDSATAYREREKEKTAFTVYTKGKAPYGFSVSDDGNYVSYKTFTTASGKGTIIPNYVTESGFTEDIQGRKKVGSNNGSSSLYLIDRKKDTLYTITADDLPGLKDIPTYFNDYVKLSEKAKKDSANRAINFDNIVWAPSQSYAIVQASSEDNKDRWLCLLSAATGKLTLLDRQHDDAWIAGPGISSNNIGWLSDKEIWYESEATGYSHLYTQNVFTAAKKALTSGNYEVQETELSTDKKSFYLVTNEVHPGEQHLYKLDIASGKKTQLTSATGAHKVTLSPDEKQIAVLYSYSTKPWELFLQKNKVGAAVEQITDKGQSDLFKSYAWRDPEVVSFPAEDGAQVYGRLYEPKNAKPGSPVVLFVHGAGYLQNAHKWWSSYFREFMFNNLLADNGYYVMDIDYRASAGYGSKWRTGIYRSMGGLDLSDHIDAVKYLKKRFDIDENKVGLYGGSYGGFITLMGMFTKPEVFAAGAALRPVTDWANYNHGYTSNILNEPFTDTLAYRRSSPIYFAEGLQGHLLICHGMVDVNVHYQDVVKLTQRLIELGKDNWELASYPMEDHGFVEPSSWTDEYKRIFKLFEGVLKK